MKVPVASLYGLLLYEGRQIQKEALRSRCEHAAFLSRRTSVGPLPGGCEGQREAGSVLPLLVPLTERKKNALSMNTRCRIQCPPQISLGYH